MPTLDRREWAKIGRSSASRRCYSRGAGIEACRRGAIMRTSRDQILTSHVGSLPRPDELIAANRTRDAGEAIDPRQFEQTLSGAVKEVVRRQHAIGIDVPGDGEFGKSMGQRVNYGSWW